MDQPSDDEHDRFVVSVNYPFSPLERLNTDCLFLICRYLDYRTVIGLNLVSKTLYNQAHHIVQTRVKESVRKIQLGHSDERWYYPIYCLLDFGSRPEMFQNVTELNIDLLNLSDLYGLVSWRSCESQVVKPKLTNSPVPRQLVKRIMSSYGVKSTEIRRRWTHQLYKAHPIYGLCVLMLLCPNLVRLRLFGANVFEDLLTRPLFDIMPDGVRIRTDPNKNYPLPIGLPLLTQFHVTDGWGRVFGDPCHDLKHDDRVLPQTIEHFLCLKTLHTFTGYLIREDFDKLEKDTFLKQHQHSLHIQAILLTKSFLKPWTFVKLVKRSPKLKLFFFHQLRRELNQYDHVVAYTEIQSDLNSTLRQRGLKMTKSRTQYYGYEDDWAGSPTSSIEESIILIEPDVTYEDGSTSLDQGEDMKSLYDRLLKYCESI